MEDNPQHAILGESLQRVELIGNFQLSESYPEGGCLIFAFDYVTEMHTLIRGKVLLHEGIQIIQHSFI